MTDLHTIQKLEHHIKKLSKEIDVLAVKQYESIPVQEFEGIKTNLETLSNLRALAKNELFFHLHQYRFTISGKQTDGQGKVKDKTIKAKLFTRIDCDLGNNSVLDQSIPSHKSLIELINNNYASVFEQGQAQVTGITQVK